MRSLILEQNFRKIPNGEIRPIVFNKVNLSTIRLVKEEIAVPDFTTCSKQNIRFAIESAPEMFIYNLVGDLSELA